ncbi:hypothetical protein HHK36_030187 [Tetracentron sinense]|uniref:Disease resistance protein n=1 Tax=Tetracentron sinense TaxID=13715 RepID=A0A835D3A3_TETSI|nr:hypothetical protein HHK36_030187 [Tetracentron sinense]
MAEAIVTVFLQKLVDLVAQEADFLAGVEEQLQLLRTDLEWIRSFLKDADGRRRENERVNVWVSQIRDVAYDAEDVIDTFLIKIEQQRRNQHFSHGFWCFLSRPPAFHDVGKKIKEINKRIERIRDNKSRYGIEDIDGEISGSSNEGPSRKEKRTPIVEEVDVVGFEDDEKTLTRKLIEGETQRAIISIVGMGGLGKTTIAKKIYNRRVIKRHFDCHAWVYVSQEYQIRELLQEIIKCIIGRNEFEMTEEELGRKLSEHLNQRRYLVVLDDIWSIEAWERLESAFPKGQLGSRVLITTRNKDVAKFAYNRSPPHELRFLREDECWDLFCKKAFRDVNHSCPTDLEMKARSSTEWEKVLKTISWHLSEGQSQISKILALSYDDLPFYLKSCFLYFGIFPEDKEIPNRRLIQLWVAEGFIEERRGETLEEVAEDYLQELIDRSMIQVGKRSSDGRVKACCVHDLFRDLSILEARKDKFLQVDGNIEDSASPVRSRRLVVHHNINRRYVPLSRLASNLRSLFWLTPMGNEGSEVIFSHGSFKLLRILDFGETISSLPKEVGDLIHLRYLGIELLEIRTLPSSIGNLRNLQTINMGKSYIRPPNSFWKLQQLRNVRAGAGIEVVGCPQMNHLKNLQMLTRVAVGRWIEHGLSQLTNLRKLGLDGRLSLQEEALSRSLVKLEHLHSLKLMRGDTMQTFAFFEHLGHLNKLYLRGLLKELPRVHEFPPNLTKLTLIHSKLEQDPMVTLEKLPNLQILRLLRWSYVGDKIVCTGRGFHKLGELILERLDGLEEWTVMDGAMLSLKCLSILDCFRFKMLPEGLLHLTTLQELILGYASERLTVRPKDNREDWYNMANTYLREEEMS